MDRHKEHVVLTRVGKFYELYFEHAEKYAPQLNIKVAVRNFKSVGNFAFAGFPEMMLDKYLKILVNDLGYSVAISEQFVDDSNLEHQRNKIYRRVARIVTPGTLIDEALRNFQKNNFLLSISFPENPFKTVANPDMKIGLAWTDIALGDFYVQESSLKNLMTDISRIKPSEMLMEEYLANENLQSGKWYPELTEFRRYYVRYQNLPSKRKSISSFYDMFNDNSKSLDRCFQELTQKEISASISILYYIQENLPHTDPNLALPERQLPSVLMQIDPRTVEALELHKTIRDDKKTGSLISALKRTVTASGTRLLSQWVSAPSTQTNEIRRRQKLVELFAKKTFLRADVISKLKKSSDITRIIQRLSLGKVDGFDLVALARSLIIVEDIKQSFIKQSGETKAAAKVLDPLIASFVSPIELANRILDLIDEDALIRRMKRTEKEEEAEIELGIKESSVPDDNHELNEQEWIVRKNASELLRRIHDEYEHLLDEKNKLLNNYNVKFVEELGCRSVKMEFHKLYGYVVSVSGSIKSLNQIEATKNFTLATSSTKSVKYYHCEKWKRIGTDIQSHVERIRNEEDVITSKLRKEILNSTFEIRNVAHVLDYIDVTSSFATLACEKNLVCPKLTTGTELKIVGGRHLVVEDGLNENSQLFTSNDCSVGCDNKILWIISGPNMGGKSTFLRQNALIVIMAQIGSFVPADEATIGIVDKVFSRVGAADDLYRDLSTFMVEMVETSFILKNATKKSLAILDEVGRGTSGKEGLAISYSTLLYLLKVNNCRTLFATHFGMELSQLITKLDDKEKFLEKIAFYCTTIDNVIKDDNTSEGQVLVNGSNFIFNHKLQKGISSKSYAIEVAQMAGFPYDAVTTASDALQKL
ncbi:hypothetical protein PACTADRAFT_55941, partial [Pachysolen tannophilus NRRL Y-2460]